jgi:fumarate reductase subunit D
VISLFAWHAAHRLLCTLHDFGIHKGLAAKSLFYGAALLLTLVVGWNLLALGF